MSPKIKNTIIIVVVAAVLILVYIFFFNKPSDTPNLVSSDGTAATTEVSSVDSSAVGEEFVSILLNVKTIKLDDSVLSDPTFTNLRDSTIYLIQDGKEGRTNPFAPIGVENSVAPVNNLNITTSNTTDINTVSSGTSTAIPASGVSVPDTVNVPIPNSNVGKTN